MTKSLILAVQTVLSILCLASSTMAVEWSCKFVDKKPPAGLDPTIQSCLSPKVIQVTKGSTLVYEFWLRSDTPLKTKPASISAGLKSLKESTLIGAAQVAREERDYREDELYAGLYTVRFSLQPQDGDHLGTSEYPYFAVLTPAKLDKKLDGLGTYDDLMEASGQESATGHPFILSLWPADKDDGKKPRITKPADDHKGLRVTLPAHAKEEKSSLTFDIIIDGMAPH